MNVTIEDLKNMINEYSENEHAESYNFDEYPLEKLPILCTTIGEDELLVELFFDIINHREYYYIDDFLVKTIQYESAEEMHEANCNANFDDMFRVCSEVYYSFDYEA